MSDQVESVMAFLAELDKKVTRLLAERDFDTKVPVTLRDAAEICHVEYLWLKERVQRREIVAYRNGERASWRVFPKDVRAFLMASTNQQPERRRSVLRRIS